MGGSASGGRALPSKIGGGWAFKRETADWQGRWIKGDVKRLSLDFAVVSVWKN